MPDAQLGAEPVFLSVLRRQYDSGLDRVLRIVDLDLLSIQDDLSAFLGVHAEDRSRRLCTARAHQARESDNLALIEVLDFKNLFPLFTFDSGELFFDLTANHVGDDLIHGRVLKIHGRYVLTVTHDRHTVDNVLKFFQSVRNINDSAALCSQILYNPEQIFNLSRCQR